MLLAVASLLIQTQLITLDRAHSHNDYTRARPLMDALDSGFSSVEADIFLVDGKLLVGHDAKDLNPERNLIAMYLKPLEDRLKANDGWVYAKSPRTFWVLVDIKTDGVAVYEAFKRELDKHPLLKYNPQKPAIRFVISGDRPIEQIVKDTGRIAALDGRWADLEKGYSKELMPWVSEAWTSHFAWQGGNEFPAEMATKLDGMVKKVHDQGRKLRFWGALDLKPVWEAQWKAGVDWINTDQPKVLREWMLEKMKPGRQSAPMTRFKDRTADFGLQIAGDGACWVDVDNDGWSDLCAGGNVWKNEKGKGFTKLASLGACVAADFDNDGFTDFFSWSQMKLFRNEKGQAFTPFALPELPATISRGACWGDFNGDGFVDIYIGGYEDWEKQITYPSLILMNQAGKSFSLARSEAKYRSRGITACDFDMDGDLDVYSSNYRLQPNNLWLNDGKGVFKDIAPDYNAVATSAGFEGGHSIGACWGDFDGDGLIDLFAGNFAHVDSRGDQPKSRFLKNLGAKGLYKFEDKGTCGVFYQESYASPSAADFDNDGDLDLYFTTVYATASFGKKNFPVLFRNDGAFEFNDATAPAELSELGPTYQGAWADFDHDGDLDLVTAGKLFENQGTAGNWLEIRLKGDGKKVNRSAVGAQAIIKLKGKTLIRQVEAGTGEGNQNDLVLHFGLGAQTERVEVEIHWPGGKQKSFRRVFPNSIVDIELK